MPAQPFFGSSPRLPRTNTARINAATRSLVVLLPLVLGACASITGTKSQPMTVTTVCEGDIVQGVSCSLSNDKGIWQVQSTGLVTIRKSVSNLAIVCTRGASSGTASYVSKSNAGVWGNILN